MIPTLAVPGARVGGLEHRVGGGARRHEHHARVRAGLGHRLVHRVEDRHALDVLAALAGRHARHEVSPVATVVEPVEAALAARQPRDHELRLPADEDAHRVGSAPGAVGAPPPPPTSAPAWSVPDTSACEAAPVPGVPAPTGSGCSPDSGGRGEPSVASSTPRAAAPSIVFSTCTPSRFA